MTEIDDVLDWFVDSGDGPEGVEKWVESYPEHEKDIREFAVAWATMNRFDRYYPEDGPVWEDERGG